MVTHYVAAVHTKGWCLLEDKAHLIQVQEMLSSGCKPEAGAPSPLWERDLPQAHVTLPTTHREAPRVHTPHPEVQGFWSQQQPSHKHIHLQASFPRVCKHCMEFFGELPSSGDSWSCTACSKDDGQSCGRHHSCTDLVLLPLCTSQVLAVLLQAQPCLLAQVLTTNPRFRGTSVPCRNPRLLCSIFHSVPGY